MEELMKLKETLCNELEEYSRKGKMSAGDLEVVDKLTHTIKNLDKIIENYDEYSGAMGGDYSRRYSMARDGRGRGRNANRDSRGRYSSRGGYPNEMDGYSNERMNGYSREGYSGHDMVMELRELMEDAPDERTRMEFEKFIRKMEMM